MKNLLNLKKNLLIYFAICFIFRIFEYSNLKHQLLKQSKMAHNIPTQEEALLIYLQNQINQTDGNIIRIKQILIRLNKDFDEAQSREARMEFARLIDNEALGLENYQFRLDFLQTMLENAQNDFEQTLNFK